MDEFSRAVARVAAAQTAEVTGFDACHESAIDILGGLVLRYISSICSGAHSYAELAGRSMTNLADLMLALEDMGVCPDDLLQYVRMQEQEVEFPHPLAPYPVHRQRPAPPTPADKHEALPPGAAHIPPFLPAFPDTHTYQHTPAYAGHESDPTKLRQAVLQGKHNAEAALIKLHQRLASSTAAAAKPDTNPFLQPPLVEQVVVGATAEEDAAGLAAGGLLPEADGGTAGGGGGQRAAPVFDTNAVRKAFAAVMQPEVVQGGGGGGDEAGEADAGEAGGGDAASAGSGGCGWLGWMPDSGAGGSRGSREPLVIPLDASSAARRLALALAPASTPPDAYGERARGALQGGRQRKSRYDYDPKVRRAEEILAAGPDAVYAGGEAAMELDDEDTEDGGIA